MIKGLIYHEDIAVLNVTAANNRATKYVEKTQKLIELKGEICKSTITGGDFNVPFLTVDSITTQKISKDIEELITPLINKSTGSN